MRVAQSLLIASHDAGATIFRFWHDPCRELAAR
jgi:hypothetical protein